MPEENLDALIFTAQPNASYDALSEIRQIDSNARLVGWLEPGVGYLELTQDWHVFAPHFRKSAPIFCRHICPVQFTFPVSQASDDFERLVAASDRFVVACDLGRSFSVQTRLVGDGWAYKKYDVNTVVADSFVAQGGILDVRQPEQVVSIVLTPERGFVGLSDAKDNLSSWAGGLRRFKREVEQISRAEFKLLEAIEAFNLTVPDDGVGLDLGAAPGGWTRVLCNHGMHVVAVDPADLDKRVVSRSNVKHVRKLAQPYLAHTEQQFDVILNDIRIDAHDTAQIMLDAERNLKPVGWALVTLKLPQNQQAQIVASALAILTRRYHIIGARQLFHNRSEVTVALRKITRRD